MKWTEDQIEEAYLYWSSEGRRSYKSTAEYTQIPERTVYYIAKRDDWPKRYAAEMTSLAGPAVETFKAEVRLSLSAAALRLNKIIAESRDEASVIKAVALLASLAMDPTSNVSDGRKVLSLTEAKLIHTNTEDSKPRDARTLATLALESNVSSTRIHKRMNK
jgi:hypothetical protein